MTRVAYGEAWIPDGCRLLAPLTEQQARARFASSDSVAIVFQSAEGMTRTLTAARHALVAYFYDIAGRVALEYTFVRASGESLFLSEARYTDYSKAASVTFWFEFETDGTYQCTVFSNSNENESIVRGRYDPRQHRESLPTFDACERLLTIERPLPKP